MALNRLTSSSGRASLWKYRQIPRKAGDQSCWSLVTTCRGTRTPICGPCCQPGTKEWNKQSLGDIKIGIAGNHQYQQDRIPGLDSSNHNFGEAILADLQSAASCQGLTTDRLKIGKQAQPDPRWTRQQRHVSRILKQSTSSLFVRKHSKALPVKCSPSSPCLGRIMHAAGH